MAKELKIDPPKKTYQFAVVAALTFEYAQGEAKSKTKDLQYNLIVDPAYNPPELDIKQYIGDDGLPVKAGCETITRVLIAALASNIKAMDNAKYMGAGEQYNYICRELKRQVESITGMAVVKILNKEGE